jgi:hypothetical protein
MPSENLDLHDYGGDRLKESIPAWNRAWGPYNLKLRAHICIPIFVQIYISV